MYRYFLFSLVHIVYIFICISYIFLSDFLVIYICCKFDCIFVLYFSLSLLSSYIVWIIFSDSVFIFNGIPLTYLLWFGLIFDIWVHPYIKCTRMLGFHYIVKTKSTETKIVNIICIYVYIFLEFSLNYFVWLLSLFFGIFVYSHFTAALWWFSIPFEIYVLYVRSHYPS